MPGEISPAVAGTVGGGFSWLALFLINSFLRNADIALSPSSSSSHFVSPPFPPAFGRITDVLCPDENFPSFLASRPAVIAGVFFILGFFSWPALDAAIILRRRWQSYVTTELLNLAGGPIAPAAISGVQRPRFAPPRLRPQSQQASSSEL
jgi:hypothetical protein